MASSFDVNDGETIRELFPNLGLKCFVVWSEKTSRYNCIAYAAGDTDHWWQHNMYWPDSAPRSYNTKSYIEAFKTRGYVRCTGPELEPDFEKIAIYTTDGSENGKPTHAARQREDGVWLSKLGKYVDIEHNSLDGLSGKEYGFAAVYMKRPRT